MIRAFVGVPLCEAAIAALLPVQEALGQGRAVAEENLHMTLAFLDDQPEAALREMNGVLTTIDAPAFEMRFSGLEARGGRKRSIVWAGVEAPAALNRLQAQVRGAARGAGIELPRTRFRPHVTLARFGRSRPVDMARLAAFLSDHGGFRAGPFAVDRFCLYASTLTPEGPAYDILADYPLA